jgi:hypothetical protein
VANENTRLAILIVKSHLVDEVGLKGCHDS